MLGLAELITFLFWTPHGLILKKVKQSLLIIGKLSRQKGYPGFLHHTTLMHFNDKWYNYDDMDKEGFIPPTDPTLAGEFGLIRQLDLEVLCSSHSFLNMFSNIILQSRGSTRKNVIFSNSLWTNSEYPNLLKNMFLWSL